MSKPHVPHEAATTRNQVLLRASRFVPGIAWMRGYSRARLPGDLLAGVTVAAVVLPIAMAYGQLAGLPAIAGVYASILPLVAYALFGSSRQLMLGPDTSTAALVTATVAPLAAGDGARYAALAALLALLTGALCVVGGMVRLGFVADFLSKPILVGYINGLALSVIASQLGKVFGISFQSSSFLGQLGELLSKLPQTNWLALAIGAGVLATVLLLRRFAPRVPGPLIAVIGATLVAGIFNLDARGVATVGAIPAGLPALQFPAVTLSDVSTLLPAAAGIVLVTFSDAILNARTFAARNGYEINANQELIGLGVADLSAGISQGFPVSGSGTRTAVNDSAGGKTQLVGIVAACSLAVILLFLTAPLSKFPNAALGAVLIAATLSLIDIPTMLYLYHIRKTEFAIAVVTMLGVLTTGLLQSIVLAIGLSLLLLLARTVRPHDAVLGHVRGLDGFHDVGDYPGSETVPGLIVYRFDAPLFFANAHFFRNRVRLLIAEADAPVEWMILDAEAITDMDSTAVEILAAVQSELASADIILAVARAKHHLRDIFDHTGLTAAIGERYFFPSIRTAVGAFLTRATM